MTTIDRLADLIDRHTPAEGLNATPLPRLWLARASCASGPISVVHEPALCLIARGAKQIDLAGETYRYDPAHFLLVSVDLPFVSQVVRATTAEPYAGLRLDLDLALVRELIADAPEPSPTESGRGLAIGRLDPALLDAATRLVSLVESPRDLPVLAPLVAREITYRLLVGPLGPRLRQIAHVGAHTHRVARAIDLLRREFDRPLRVDELARAAHMSPSSFHQHFKAVTAMSPVQYQKRLRLHEARRLMLADALDASSAAYRVGYESPSQFSRDYRRAFGEPPRRDLSKLLASPSRAADL
jgi:AraC-like DNA-binding protein